MIVERFKHGGPVIWVAMEEVRQNAKSWQTIHEGPGRGLALAEF